MSDLVDPYFLTLETHPITVVASALIAFLAVYVALEMAGRIRQSRDRTSVGLWICAGALVLGSGAWATQFVALSAAVYPFQATLVPAITLAAWIAAVFVAALLLSAVCRRHASVFGLLCWTLAAAVFTVGLHFFGMLALAVSPSPTYRAAWIIGSLLGSMAGNALALLVFRKREPDGWPRVRRQIAAASIYGSTLAATNFLLMAATDYDDRTVSLVREGLDVQVLGMAVAFDSAIFLSLILLITLIERRAVTRAARLDGSLTKVQQELDHVTSTDPLTGLPNRLVFQDRLQQAASRCDRIGESLAVLYIKLDGFRPIDESSDPEAIAMLRLAAASLVDVCRSSDTVANLGGHHFAVMTDGLSDARPAIHVAEHLAFVLRTRHLGVGGSPTASIGIALYPDDGPMDGIVRHAAAAASSARADGGNCFRFFEARMNDAAHAKTRWLEDLRTAVLRDEFELHYQPEVHAASNRVVGVEALLRWHHPKHGMVGPAVFIPLAEQFGLINELGSWVIGEACRQMGAWGAAGLPIRVAINLSVHQLRRAELADEITAALAANQVAPALLTCEITESSAMDDTRVTFDVFESLQAIGVQLSIDDFGTGYSSLSYLRKLPVRQLKIDRSFIADLDTDDAPAISIVKAIVDLAHALRLEVVAEGVETETQRARLLALGCDKFQGYLFSTPVSAADLLPVIAGLHGRSLDRRESLLHPA